MVLCPSASLDAEGSQPPATAPEGHDSLVGPMSLPPFVGSLRHSLKHL